MTGSSDDAAAWDLFDVVALAAAAVLAAAVRPAGTVDVALVLAGVGLLAVAAVRPLQGRAAALVAGPGGVAVAALVLTTGAAAWAFGHQLIDGDHPLLPALWDGLAGAWLGLVIVVAAVWAVRRSRVPQWAAAAIATLVIVVSTVAGAVLLLLEPGPVVDVHILHTTAADALAAGRTPFAGLDVGDGSPFATDGEVIDGYPYPPVTLGWYAGWHLVTGDPRWASLVAWLATLALSHVLLRRRLPDRPLAAAAMLLAVAAQPGWLYVVQYAWTEPLSVALSALALVLWRRSATASGTAYGLLLASKQYFLVAGPAALLARIPRRRTWLTATLAAGACALAIGLVGGPRWFWRSNVLFHLGRHPRPDSSNLYGLVAGLRGDWLPQTWLTLGAAAVVAIMLGRRARDARGVLLATTAAVSATFLLGPQAFGNYWFLASGLAFLAAVAPAGTSGDAAVTGAGGGCTPPNRPRPRRDRGNPDDPSRSP